MTGRYTRLRRERLLAHPAIKSQFGAVERQGRHALQTVCLYTINIPKKLGTMPTRRPPVVRRRSRSRRAMERAR